MNTLEVSEITTVEHCHAISLFGNYHLDLTAKITNGRRQCCSFTCLSGDVPSASMELNIRLTSAAA
jgi:hypothetical protein